MKAIYLLLLLVGFSYSQIETLLSVPDTSSLKTMSVGLGGAMFLRGYSSSTNNGAGIYIVVDSAYAEGTQAFDHPTRGYQWYLMSNQTLNDSSVTGSKIQSATINTSNLANASITTSKLADSSVTSEKIATAVQNEFIPTVADTTALKAKSGSVTKLVHLSEISLSAGVGGGDFVYKASGYTANKVTVFDASGGGYYVRKEWDVNKGLINVEWAGAKGDNSTDNLTALQTILNVTPLGEVYFPKTSSNIYKVSGTLLIEKSITLVGGSPDTKIQLTAEDTLIVMDESHFKIKNLRFYGPGKNTNSTCLFLGVQSGGTYDNNIENVIIEYFGRGIETSYLSGFTTKQVETWYCGVGFGFGDQGDALTMIEPKANYCDTAFVVGIDRETLGEAPITLINPWTQSCGIDYFVYDRNHVLNIFGFYSENADTLGIVQANSGNNYVNIQGGHIQQLNVAGWKLNGGYFKQSFIKGSITAIDTFFVVAAAGTHYKSNDINLNGGTTPGGSANAQIQYGTLLYGFSRDLSFGNKNNYLWDANGVSDYYKTSEFINGNGAFVEKWSRINTSGTSLWSAFIKDYGGATSYPVLGIDGGYLQIGNNTTKNPNTAASGLRGYLFSKDGTEASPDDPDSLLVCVYNGPEAAYDWYDLVSGSFRSFGPTAGHNAFGATALHDTVRIVGLDDNLPNRNYYVTVTPYTSSPDSSTVLSVTVTTDTLFVHRPYNSSGTLNYNWIWKQVP